MTTDEQKTEAARKAIRNRELNHLVGRKTHKPKCLCALCTMFGCKASAPCSVCMREKK